MHFVSILIREKLLSIPSARFNGQSNDTRVKNSCWDYSEVSLVAVVSNFSHPHDAADFNGEPLDL